MIIRLEGGVVMAKMGRPKVDDDKRKTITLGVRVTPNERQEIEDYAERHNQTITQVFKAGFVKLLEEESR